MDSNTIRERFLAFFSKRGHQVVPSSSLVPADDPTLLFTNAGMVPFKSYFTKERESPFPCAVSAQRCVRAGGKHNDLENVGVTARHHTFFEMLGFFSFGDYFKEKAIVLAWSFLTEELGIDADKLWITVHKSDQEAADLWHKKIGVAKDRIVFCGDEDNFWAMGDSGPCGPCTEIFYDHGPSVAGGPPGSKDADGDRFVEIWNLVFMQYNRVDGALTPLPEPAVDTGMGLERIAAVMQGVHDNYETDVLKALQETIVATYPGQNIESLVLRVLADHLRAMVFLLADQVLPSNEGRGYVLRRIMRRAMCYAHRSNIALPCLHQWVERVGTLMAPVFPGDATVVKRIVKQVKEEEMRFSDTLAHGLSMLSSYLDQDKNITGEVAFQLYDTHGLPLEVTVDWTALQGGSVDEAGFAACMAKQKAKSKQSAHFTAKVLPDTLAIQSRFTGHDGLGVEGCIKGLLNQEGHLTSLLGKGDQGGVVLDQTPFYPEGGGQIGDRGVLVGKDFRFLVQDTQKVGDAIVHYGQVVDGKLQEGDALKAEVDASRLDTARHHTATHLLHAALRDVLGDEVSQRGSYVGPDRLRFDFAYGKPLALETLQKLESWVGDAIRANVPCASVSMSLDEAKKIGAMALFDEKYESEVRVLKIGERSIELCGGTHVQCTGEIGSFVILNTASVASGVRRIEALAGVAAEQWLQAQTRSQHALAKLMQCNVDQLLDKAQLLQERMKQLSQLSAKSAQADLAQQVAAWYQSAPVVADCRIVAQVVSDIDGGALRQVVDALRQQPGPWLALVIVRGAKEGEKVPFVCALSKEMKGIKAQALVELLAPMGGRGGGRDDFVQGAVLWGDGVSALIDRLPSWWESQAKKH